MSSAEAEQIAGKIRDTQQKMAPTQVTMARGANNAQGKLLKDAKIREPGVTDEQFPTAALTAGEPKDVIMSAKAQLQTDGVTPFGVLEAKDEDFSWLMRKQAAAEYGLLIHNYHLFYRKLTFVVYSQLPAMVCGGVRQDESRTKEARS
jgi:hypothetical protein